MTDATAFNLVGAGFTLLSAIICSYWIFQIVRTRMATQNALKVIRSTAVGEDIVRADSKAFQAHIDKLLNSNLEEAVVDLTTARLLRNTYGIDNEIILSEYEKVFLTKLSVESQLELFSDEAIRARLGAAEVSQLAFHSLASRLRQNLMELISIARMTARG